MLRKATQELLNYLRAKDNLIYALTYEEDALIEELCMEIRKRNEDNSMFPKKIYVFTRPTGLYEVDILNPTAFNPNRVVKEVRPDVVSALKFILSKQNGKSADNDIRDILQKNKNKKEQSSALFIFKDMHLFFNDKDVIRMLRNLKENYLDLNYNPIIVTAPVIDLPPELEKIFTLFEFPTMNKQEIAELIKNNNNIDAKDFKSVVDMLTGLTKREMLRAILHSMAEDTLKQIRPECIHKEKLQIVKKSGVLDFLVPHHTLADLGGSKNFKDWIKKLKEAMTDEAKAFGIPEPKGAMLVGVPGTSKTVSAEILASYLGVPLLSLDMAKVMGSFVGQSERQIANALRIAQSIAPCVLLIDECEKALGGYASSNNCDSGTLSRVMGQILGFLQKDNTGVITIMTSNDVTQLPPELTRSGRLDAQWMFDLPNEEERREILNIYLKKYNLKLTDSVFERAANLMENFTGAEIKAAVKDILINSFYRQKEMRITEFTRDAVLSDVEDAIKNTITVYRSSKEKIEAFRAYAKDRYLNASAEMKKAETFRPEKQVIDFFSGE